MCFKIRNRNRLQSREVWLSLCVLLLAAPLVSQQVISPWFCNSGPASSSIIQPPSACDPSIIITSLSEYDQLPPLTVTYVLHFIADDLGRNFTCDPNHPDIDDINNDIIYAPTYIKKVNDNINNHLASALLIDGEKYDTHITFEPVSFDCSGHFFHDNGPTVEYNLRDARALTNSDNYYHILLRPDDPLYPYRGGRC